MNASLDHVVVGATDLSLLVAWWKQQAGSSPIAGGSHPGAGTRNALIGVDDSTYVELLAFDPAQPDPDMPRPFGLDRLEPNSVQVCTFVLAVDDMEAALEAVRAAGLEPGEARSMSRTRTDGTELHWTLAIPPDQGMNGVLPSLIDWGAGTSNPGASLESVVNVAEIQLGLPDPEPLQTAFAGLGFDTTVAETPEPMLSVNFTTPDTSFWL